MTRLKTPFSLYYRFTLLWFHGTVQSVRYIYWNCPLLLTTINIVHFFSTHCVVVETYVTLLVSCGLLISSRSLLIRPLRHCPNVLDLIRLAPLAECWQYGRLGYVALHPINSWPTQYYKLEYVLSIANIVQKPFAILRSGNLFKVNSRDVFTRIYHYGL